MRVLSVADGLDSDDEESSLGIQVRGIFNELQLADLRKKTLRGQMGQKRRGFTVGEATFGYKSFPVGTFRTDKKGRSRPEGYRMLIEAREARVVLRVFEDFAAGESESHIVRRLNEDSVPGRRRAKGWSPSTIRRMLDNQKYIGRWIWNRRQTRRDPRTGRRRQLPKPESEWIITVNEALRIVPSPTWDAVQERLHAARKVWPGGRGCRGFESQRGSRVEAYPSDLLSGAMRCGVCGGSMPKVSGKAGGYYGCLAATRRKCENRLLVRRSLAEQVIIGAVAENLGSAKNLPSVIRRMDAEIARTLHRPVATLRLKEDQLQVEEERIANFVYFIGRGRGTDALAGALRDAEQRRDVLKVELERLRRNHEAEAVEAPLVGDSNARLRAFLERRTGASALLLRQLIGKIRLEPMRRGGRGKSYYLAKCDLFAVALRNRVEGAARSRRALERTRGESTLGSASPSHLSAVE